MSVLLVSKEQFNLKQAREIAREYKVTTKCRTLLIGIELYFCFGTVPDEHIIYEIDFTVNNKVFFLSVL